MKQWAMTNNCCQYHNPEAMKINPMDSMTETASPSCLQFPLEYVNRPRHLSLAKVIITNSPMNMTPTQLEKNTGNHTGGGSRRCGRGPSVGLLMASIY
jgi:hypothetical protein